MDYPILRYPDPKQGYILYTDASGIGWLGVLTQEYKDEKGKIKNHPICYVSGQFCGSQLNWAALTKEAYAIYMSIRRLTFYVTDAEVTIKCDHLPLKKFLNKQTMNSKVNNWAVELEQFKLRLDWILGSQNLLMDSLSRLLNVDSDARQTDEPEGHEFGSYCFEDLQPAKVLEVINTEVIELKEVNSEDEEHSLKSRKPLEVKNIESTQKLKTQHEQQSQASDSKSGEDSQNSRISTEVGTFELEYSKKPLKYRKLLDVSESSESSQNSRKGACIQITEYEEVKEITLPLKPRQLQELQRMTRTAEKLPKSYTGMWNYRKYLLRKRESCTGCGLRMDELLSVS